MRRLAAGIRQQDWFTVVLEVLIVVVSIIVGLQVDGWNEGRKDRIEERAYLERLSLDLKVIWEMSDDSIIGRKTL